MATTPKRKVPVVEKKAFSLDKYKKDKGLDKDVKFKIQEYIPTSKAFFDTTGVNIPISSLTCLFGHTNSGKTTLLFETAIACQKMGIIPVFVITELKFSFEHLKLMGFQMDEIVDENTGEITYDGNFIYLDRSSFETIEEMGEKVMEIMSDQSKGLLKDEHGKHLNICFLLDSIGTISSNLSRDSNKSNNEWDAGSISRVFGKGIFHIRQRWY
jgi:RecA/RadA recombinase